MFLIRSAFWLTVAFVAFHPHDIDFGKAVDGISHRALDAGRQVVVEQIASNGCVLAGCAVAVPTATPQPVSARPDHPSVGSPMQDSPIDKTAPVPRPRPVWMS